MHYALAYFLEKYLIAPIRMKSPKIFFFKTFNQFIKTESIPL